MRRASLGSLYVILRKSCSCLHVHLVLFTSPSSYLAFSVYPVPLPGHRTLYHAEGCCEFMHDFIFLLIIALASLLPFELIGAARQAFGVFGGHEVNLGCSRSCLAVLLRISLLAFLTWIYSPQAESSNL
jgi:hypothetical protein